MKRLLLAAVICMVAPGLFAHGTGTDTVKAPKDTVKHGYHIFFDKKKPAIEKEVITDSTKRVYHKSPGFSWGFTFSRFDLGLATLLDNGSFTLAPQNQFLRYRSWKTSNVGFDVVQVGYRFNSAFKIYAAGGFDWTLIRLRENITIQRGMPTLTYTNDNIIYSKNRFSASYFRVPLSFDFRTHDDDGGAAYHFVLGPEFGVLLDGRVKQISDENGKQKIDGGYHFAKYRYGAVGRAGHGVIGIFAKYYFNDMFEDSPPQKGLKDFAFGFTFGF